ncbi:MAG: DUF732 domain-containing protein [Arachnia propionica]|uniref:DUF732 domain-containing protein n=1 Tax=Arachnia propionica TaxID=1750 RepID=UPI0027073421|nr:DUF732 domain-containing protein [Arachnia propionica]
MNRLVALAAALLTALSLAACSGSTESPSTMTPSTAPSSMEEGTAGESTGAQRTEVTTTPAPDMEGDPAPVFIGMLEVAGVERGTATDDQLTVAGHQVCAAFDEGQSLGQVVEARTETELAGMDEKSYKGLALAASEVLCSKHQERIAKEFQES